MLPCFILDTECVRLTKWYQNIFSICLKFGAYYVTGQWGEFKIKMLLNAFIYISGIFLFFIIKFVFLSFSFLFFDELSNFRNRILTNQKYVLVVSNCQWNCMLHLWLNSTIFNGFHKAIFTCEKLWHFEADVSVKFAKWNSFCIQLAPIVALLIHYFRTLTKLVSISSSVNFRRKSLAVDWKNAIAFPAGGLDKFWYQEIN